MRWAGSHKGGNDEVSWFIRGRHDEMSWFIQEQTWGELVHPHLVGIWTWWVKMPVINTEDCRFQCTFCLLSQFLCFCFFKKFRTQQQGLCVRQNTLTTSPLYLKLGNGYQQRIICNTVCQIIPILLTSVTTNIYVCSFLFFFKERCCCFIVVFLLLLLVVWMLDNNNYSALGDSFFQHWYNN